MRTWQPRCASRWTPCKADLHTKWRVNGWCLDRWSPWNFSQNTWDVINEAAKTMGITWRQLRPLETSFSRHQVCVCVWSFLPTATSLFNPAENQHECPLGCQLQLWPWPSIVSAFFELVGRPLVESDMIPEAYVAWVTTVRKERTKRRERMGFPHAEDQMIKLNVVSIKLSKSRCLQRFIALATTSQYCPMAC